MFRCQRKCHRFEPDILLQVLWVVNSVGRVPALHAGCREFESLTTHQSLWRVGRVWLIALVLKTSNEKSFVSSNLTLSAILYPIGEMNITSCYEREVGSLILSLGARKMGRMVMQRIANPYSCENSWVSSTLTSSAKLCEYGEIGRHSRLKICRRKSCQFDSGYSHQICLVSSVG